MKDYVRYGQHAGDGKPALMRALAFATIIVSATPLAAVEPGGVTVACMAPRIVVIGSLPERWQTPLAEACVGMHGLADIDQNASVVISGDDASLIVDVTTADGREAVRHAHNPLTLRDTLEALLTVPTKPAADVTPQVPSQPQPSAPSPDDVPEFGIALSGRMATARRAMLGPTVYGAVHMGNWLLGGSLRWDALQNRGPNTAPHYELGAIAAGITFGGRVSQGLVDCDIAFEPRLIAESQSYRSGDREIGSTTADIWVAGLIRTAFGRGSVRPYVQADVEMAPNRVGRSFVSDTVFQALPSWSVGLALGVTMGIQ